MNYLGIVKNVMLLVAVSVLGTACYHDHHGHYGGHYHDPGPGPHGFDGEAYLAIDYTYHHPYSYWDDNPDLPYNPQIGVFHHTYPGIYEFEYFINPYEYWYGTYELWINPGGPGQPHGVAGYNGADNYFSLFCDPDGFWMGLSEFGKRSDDGTITIDQEIGDLNLRVVMQKTTVDERPAQAPKLK